MYVKCHSKMTEDEIFMSICKLLVNPRFEEWNTKSVSFALILALGYNGVESRRLIIEILDKFYQWYVKTNSDNYIPLRSTEKMYSQRNIMRMIGYVKNIDESKITQDKKGNHRLALVSLNDLWNVIDTANYIDSIEPIPLWKRLIHLIRWI